MHINIQCIYIYTIYIYIYIYIYIHAHECTLFSSVFLVHNVNMQDMYSISSKRCFERPDLAETAELRAEAVQRARSPVRVCNETQV